MSTPNLPPISQRTVDAAFWAAATGAKPKSVKDAETEMNKRLRVLSISGHTEGRKYAILSFLSKEGSQESQAALKRFDFVTPRIVRPEAYDPKTGMPTRKKHKSGWQRPERPKANKGDVVEPSAPMYEDFVRGPGLEILGGLPASGKNRKH